MFRCLYECKSLAWSWMCLTYLSLARSLGFRTWRLQVQKPKLVPSLFWQLERRQSFETVKWYHVQFWSVRDWLGRTSPKWHLVLSGRKTLILSIGQSVCCYLALSFCVKCWHVEVIAHSILKNRIMHGHLESSMTYHCCRITCVRRRKRRRSRRWRRLIAVASDTLSCTNIHIV